MPRDKLGKIWLFNFIGGATAPRLNNMNVKLLWSLIIGINLTTASFVFHLVLFPVWAEVRMDNCVDKFVELFDKFDAGMDPERVQNISSYCSKIGRYQM